MISRLDKTLVKNIKGKTLGKTLKAHAEIPEREADIYFDGFVSIQNKIKIIKTDNKSAGKEASFFVIFFFKTFSKIV